MTVDLTVAPGFVDSTQRRQIVQYTGPVLYAAGGEAVDPKQVRMGKVFAILGAVITSGSAIRVGVYVPSTGKLQWFVPNTGAEVGAVDLSTFSGRLEFVGQ